MKDELFERYKTFFEFWLIVLCITVLILVLLIIFRRKLLTNINNVNQTRFLRIIVFTVLTIFVIYSSTKFTLLCLDLELVQSNDCEIFVGEFIDYTKYVESNEPGNPRGSSPLFRDVSSNAEIVLSGTQHYEVGKTYIIYYLPKSMVYVIEEVYE